MSSNSLQRATNLSLIAVSIFFCLVKLQYGGLDYAQPPKLHKQRTAAFYLIRTGAHNTETKEDAAEVRAEVVVPGTNRRGGGVAIPRAAA